MNYRNSSRQAAVLMAVVLLAFTASCARRAGSNLPASAYEQALVLNASAARVNLSFAQAVIDAHGQGFVSIERTDKLLGFSYRMADTNEQITGILRRGPEVAQADSAKLQELIRSVVEASQQLISSGDLGIKNPQAQSAALGYVTAVSVIAEDMIRQLKLAGVLK